MQRTLSLPTRKAAHEQNQSGRLVPDEPKKRPIRDEDGCARFQLFFSRAKWIGSGSGHCTGFGTDFVHLDGRLMQDLVHPARLLRDQSAQIGFGLIKRIADSLGLPKSLEINLRAESETW